MGITCLGTTEGTKAPRPLAHVGDVRAGPLRGPFCWTIKHKPAPEVFRAVLKPLCTAQVLEATPSVWDHRPISITRRQSDHVEVFLRRLFDFQGACSPGYQRAHGTGLSHPHCMHSPGVMSVTLLCRPIARPEDRHLLCLSAVRNPRIHSPPRRNSSLKGQCFSAGDAAFCQRIAHQQSTALAHPGHGHPPQALQRHWPSEVSLSVSRWVRACASYKPVTPYDEPLDHWQFIEFKTISSRICRCFVELLSTLYLNDHDDVLHVYFSNTQKYILMEFVELFRKVWLALTWF